MKDPISALVPVHIAAFAAGAFTHGPSTGDPVEDWQQVATALKRLGCGYDWEDLRAAAAAWSTANLPPQILLTRRWY